MEKEEILKKYFSDHLMSNDLQFNKSIRDTVSDALDEFSASREEEIRRLTEENNQLKSIINSNQSIT